MLKDNQIFSVTEVNDFLRYIIEQEPKLNLLLVAGEIVNFKKHTSGHLYFSLKDETSRIKCVMFNRQSRYLSFRPVDGMKVLIQGRLSVYAKSGEYQIYADSLHPMGVGNLHVRFLALKEKLSKEGLFETVHKRQIPLIPRAIGIVTSPTGAAIHDIVKVIKSKFPPATIILSPAKVQGLDAADEIVAGIEALNSLTEVDVIIVGRGGGATEELWSFNEEIVVRAIRNSHIPIVSAVGHEIDTTLADLAADRVAATPTAAGEMVVPDIKDLLLEIDTLTFELEKTISRKILLKRSYCQILLERLRVRNPHSLIKQKIVELKHLEKSIKNCVNSKLSKYDKELFYLETRLVNLHPVKIMEKGFALLYNDNTEVIIRTGSDIAIDDCLRIELLDSVIKAQVISKEVKRID